jgi:hypothetical protein
MNLRDSTRVVIACTVALGLTGPPVSAYAQQSQGTTTRKAEKEDLKKLEQNGYKPEAQDPHYPDDVQAAEKKAYGGSTASGPAAKSQ